ncbi:hypothetical protein ACTHQ2_23080, partial [Bacillus subtilis]|uniref:hypothetical protein n=2 Tax=Bacillales TaxID=1385 RepID=UPI003F7C1607
MNNEHCIKCGVRINEKRGPNDKPSARIVCDNCCSKAPCSQCNKALDVIGVRTDGLELLCDACKSSVPLLVIEVKDLNSVPIVRHNGVAINGMVVIEYLYGTKTHEVGK